VLFFVSKCGQPNPHLFRAGATPVYLMKFFPRLKNPLVAFRPPGAIKPKLEKSSYYNFILFLNLSVSLTLR
jgi:hypothetical protein